MLRTIIAIDEEKCNGCGSCADACHEGAIAMVNGKAKLVRDDFCDGFGDCLPTCPTGAISFEEREAAAYDEDAVKAQMNRVRLQDLANRAQTTNAARHQCPGSRSRTLEPKPVAAQPKDAKPLCSQLANWPVQIKLAPVQAPYFNGADLLIAADCTAFAYAAFHAEFMRNRVTLVGCPKLDAVDYSEKLAAIIESNNIKSVTIVKMEVPCCTGLERAALNALQLSGKRIPWSVHTISLDGRVLN